MSYKVDHPGGVQLPHVIHSTNNIETYVPQPSIQPIQPIGNVDELQARATELAWISFLQSAEFISRSQVFYFLWIKRLLDAVGAALLLVLLAPVFAVIALALRFQGTGQVIYRQERAGRFGEPFTMYKFVTMLPDRRKRELPFDGEDRRKTHKSKHDPRVTRVGRILRKTSLDELPQLINILFGQMSFIGPRPELPKIVSNYEPWQHERHLVRPGLSGWWQINGRSERPMHENTELDIYYVERLSFMLDLTICLQTIRTVLSRNGAF